MTDWTACSHGTRSSLGQAPRPSSSEGLARLSRARCSGSPAAEAAGEFDGGLAHWRLASGIEIDFILGDMEIAIEAQSSARITRDHWKGRHDLVEDHPRGGRRIVVSREPRAPETEDGIEIHPAASFVRRLWAGALA